jgi:hypothetical protein
LFGATSGACLMILLRRLVVAVLLSIAGSSIAGAAEEPPPPANQWVIECGTFGGQRYCQVFYIYTDAKIPDGFISFGIVRILGVEAPFLEMKRGFAKNSKVLIRVDDLSTRDFPAPTAERKLLSPRVPLDPLANELARGEKAAIFFKPANGVQRNIEIPLGAFGILLDQARQEVPTPTK